QPSVLRLQRLVQREVHIGRHLVEVVRDEEFEKEAGQDPLGRFHERHVRKIFGLDLRQEHFSPRYRPRDELWKEHDVEKDVCQRRAGRFPTRQVDEKSDVGEDKERDSDRQGQFEEKIDRRDPCRVLENRPDKQELVFEKRKKQEIKNDARRQPDRAI